MRPVAVAVACLLIASALALPAVADPCTPPAPPQRPFPEDGTRDVYGILLALLWEHPAGNCPTTYRINLDLVSPPTGVLCDGTAGLHCAAGVLKEDTAYFWQVIASSPGGTVEGPIWSFRTGKAPLFWGSGGVLDGPGFDIAVDAARDRVYVSIPDRQEIEILSLGFEALSRVQLRARPLGLELARDGRELFAALDGTGSIGVVDLETGEVSEIDAQQELGSPHTYDVAEARDGLLYVSAFPSAGAAYLVEIRPGDGNPVRRIESASLTGSQPALALSPDRRWLYAAGRSGPELLYLLDLEDPRGAAVVPDIPGPIAGSAEDAWDTSDLDPSPDGSQLYLPSGQVLNTADFSLARYAIPGNHEFGSRAGLIYSLRQAGSYAAIGAWDTRDFGWIKDEADFSLSNARRLLVLPGDRGWLVLGEDSTGASWIQGYTDDLDRDGVVNPSDDCLRVANSDQGDADGDGVGDVCDLCPAISDPEQRDTDGDGRGDACDPFPQHLLGVRPVVPGSSALTGESVEVSYLLEDPRSGERVTQAEGLRVTLTLGGDARFAASATRGRLISGGGAARALVEFVDGEFAIEIQDPAEQRIALGVEDTEGIGISAIPVEIHETFETNGGGFTHSGADDAWALVERDPFEPPGSVPARSWRTTAGGELVSPPYLLAESSRARLYVCGLSGLAGGSIGISTDGGATWDSLEATLLDPSCGLQYGHGHEALFRLDAYAGRTIQVRFRNDFPPNSGTSWIIDTFDLFEVANTLDFLRPEGDADGDGIDNAAELERGTSPRDADSDSDGVGDALDDCPSTMNSDQSDRIHPGGPGDACEDPDADGVSDAVDDCPDLANPSQDDRDEDGLGDACDAYPDAALEIWPVTSGFGVAGGSVAVSYRLEDHRTGRLLSELEGVRATLTLDGSASFEPEPIAGELLAGGGTNQALVEFVRGIATLRVRDPAIERVQLASEDTEGLGVALVTGVSEDFERDAGGFTHSGTGDRWTRVLSRYPSSSVAWTENFPADGLRADVDLVSRPYRIGWSGDPLLELSSTGFVPNGSLVLLQISADDGATWETLDSLPQAILLELAPYSGTTIRIRVRSKIATAASVSLDDFAIQDIGAQLEFLAPAGDEDGDGLSNASEIARGSNPRRVDSDFDSHPDGEDDCPVFASADLSDTDGNGVGDACECGDQNGDGRVDVRDLVAIRRAIFQPDQATPLCDTNFDEVCDASDVIGAVARIFGARARCARNPWPAP